MSAAFAEGGNYRIELAAGLARCEVWRRPDVDSATGARFAEEKSAHFERLARDRAVRGMIFDLRKAPPVAGPKSEAAIGAMLATFEKARKPLVVLVGDNEIQRLQVARIIRDRAPTLARWYRDPAEAERWLLLSGASAPPPSSPSSSKR